MAGKLVRYGFRISTSHDTQKALAQSRSTKGFHEGGFAAWEYNLPAGTSRDTAYMVGAGHAFCDDFCTDEKMVTVCYRVKARKPAGVLIECESWSNTAPGWSCCAKGCTPRTGYTSETFD